jgi:spore coat polysaccharide biosynthesis predicted glycosyltransferase SpsG
MMAFSRLTPCVFSIVSRHRDIVEKFMTGLDFDLSDIGELGKKAHFDIGIVDVPDIAAKKADYLRGFSDVLACLDDTGPGLDFQDILIRPNLLDLPRPAKIAPRRYWSGREYVVLHPDFAKQASLRRVPLQKVKNIVVCFGGSDPGGLTLRVLSLLKNLDANVLIHVVLGAAFAREKEVRSQVCRDRRFSVRSHIANMAPFLRKADMALISGGILLYEACSLGLPCVVISQNEGQEAEAGICHKAGAVLSLGVSAAVSDDEITVALQRIVKEASLRKKMAQRGPAIVSAAGASRIVTRLISCARKEAGS